MKKKTLKESTLDGKVKISLNLPKKLLEQLDADRMATNHTRSSWFAMAAMERLKAKMKS